MDTCMKKLQQVNKRNAENLKQNQKNQLES